MAHGYLRHSCHGWTVVSCSDTLENPPGRYLSFYVSGGRSRQVPEGTPGGTHTALQTHHTAPRFWGASLVASTTVYALHAHTSMFVCMSTHSQVGSVLSLFFGSQHKHPGCDPGLRVLLFLLGIIFHQTKHSTGEYSVGSKLYITIELPSRAAFDGEPRFQR